MNMKRKLLLVTISLISSLCMSACSTFYGEDGFIRDPDREYSNEVAPPPLILPKNVQAAQLGDDYEVPDLCANPQKPSNNLIPPGSLAEQVVEGKITPKEIKKQRQVKEASLLVVDTDMNETWDKLGGVLPRIDYQIAVANSDRRIYYILDKTATKGRITMQTPIYEIHLQMSPAGETEIFATDTSDKLLPVSVSRPMLAEIGKGLHGKVKTPWARMISELF